MSALVLYGPLILTVVLWSFQMPALHELGARWDPVTLGFGRNLLAAVAFGMLTAVVLSRRPQTSTVSQSSLAVLSVGNGLWIGGLFAGFGLLFAWGAVVGSPIVSATVTAVMPITASLVTWAVTGRKPARVLLIALVFVVPGAFLAMPPSSGTGGDAPRLGLVLIFLAQVCWSLYSLAVPRCMAGASAIASTQASILWALPYYAVACAICWGAGVGRADLSAPGIDATLAISSTVGPLVLGVVLWNLSISRLGLPICALFLNCVPVFGTLIAWAFGIVPTLLQAGGVALVILGMFIAQYRRRDVRLGRSPMPRT